jgi:hypothetical protein
MTNQIDTSLAIQFADQVHTNGQQMKTRTRDKVEVVPLTTHDKTVETLDSLEAIEITSRHQKTQGQDIVHGRRRLRMREFRATIYLDNKDEVGVLIDPERNYAASVARSMYRQFDRISTEASLATVYTGRDMTTATTASSDGVQVVDATAGLTYEKLLEIEENFIDYEIGTELQEDCCLLVAGEEHTDLMQENELTSGDFTRQFAVEKGRIASAAGLDLILFGGKVSNPILSVSAGNVRSCIAMAENAVQVGLAKDAEVYVDIRPDLNRAKQVQAVLMLGAVRKEGARVQEVQTTHTP